MIRSLKGEDTRKLFETGICKRWAAIHEVASLKLNQI
jgi:hypothetical protein